MNEPKRLPPIPDRTLAFIAESAPAKVTDSPIPQTTHKSLETYQ